jgi:hypothetical protein
MMNIPEIDLKNKNLLIIIFVCVTALLFFNVLEVKSLLSMIVLVLIIINYKDVKTNLSDDLFKKEDTITVNYNNKIEELLKQIKKYKKRDKTGFNNGMKYWYRFIETINLLEGDNIYNHNQYFDNAHLYLKEAINTFQSLSINSYDEKYIDSLKYGDFDETKEMKDISYVTKELYKEGYDILYNLSIYLNKKWVEKPNIHTKEIIFDYPLAINDADTNFDYYT